MKIHLNTMFNLDLDKLAFVSLISFVLLFTTFMTFPITTSPLKDIVVHFHLMSTFLSIFVSRLVWLKAETRLSLRHIIWRHFINAFVHRNLMSLVRSQQAITYSLLGGSISHLQARFTLCQVLQFGARLGCIRAVPFFDGPSNYLSNRLLPASSSPNNILFFVHGGGFCVHTATERLVAAPLFSRLLPLTFYAAQYSTDSSATLTDIRRAVREQYEEVRKAHPKANIVLAGDSAGGNVALHLALELADGAAGRGAEVGARKSKATSQPSAAGLLLFSPWLDVDGSANLASSRPGWGDLNDYMAAPFVRSFHDSLVRRWRAAGNVGSDVEPFGALLRRVRSKARVGGLPPMLIVSGGGELMVDEARALYLATCQDYHEEEGEEGDSAARDLASCDLYVAPRCPHDFAMNPFLCAGGTEEFEKTWDDIAMKLAQFFAVDPDELELRAEVNKDGAKGAGFAGEEDEGDAREEDFDEFTDESFVDVDALVFRPGFDGDEFASAREFCDELFFGGGGGGEEREESKKKVRPVTKKGARIRRTR